MKKSLVRTFLAIVLLCPTLGNTVHAAYDQETDDGSGWFIGSDQGVLFFVGDSSNQMNLQYYGTVFGGYNIKGIFQPMLRIAQALGTANGLGDPQTFFFMVDGGFKVTPLRTKVRPYFVGTAGFYVLNFSDFGFAVQEDTNFTYTGGGGVEIQFGRNQIYVGSEYRGFINKGDNLQAVSVTLGYAFQF